MRPRFLFPSPSRMFWQSTPALRFSASRGSARSPSPSTLPGRRTGHGRFSTASTRARQRLNAAWGRTLRWWSIGPSGRAGARAQTMSTPSNTVTRNAVSRTRNSRPAKSGGNRVVLEIAAHAVVTSCLELLPLDFLEPVARQRSEKKGFFGLEEFLPGRMAKLYGRSNALMN